VALAADPPPGLRAVVSFAGGRGSTVDGMCSESRLADAFASFGRSAQVPSIWVYAENDTFFPPPVANRLFNAYQRAGGKAVWAPMPAFGDDGHALSVHRSGVPLWLPAVEKFLTANRLPVSPGAGMAVADYLDTRPPVRLGEKAMEGWRKYLDGAPFSAFAATADGAHWGWATGKSSPQEATAAALGYCKGDCRIYAIDGRPSLH
jgi:hypothetical protein